jgi:hypothetical protein
MDGRDRVVAAVHELLDEWSGPLHAATPPEDWENVTVPQFLEAMAAYLGSYENTWTNRGQVPPTDGWVVFEDALKAARFYE